MSETSVLDRVPKKDDSGKPMPLDLQDTTPPREDTVVVSISYEKIDEVFVLDKLVATKLVNAVLKCLLEISRGSTAVMWVGCGTDPETLQLDDGIEGFYGIVRVDGTIRSVRVYQDEREYLL